MAGIGFRLQKILSENTYTSSLKAYFYAAAISCGPWLFTIVGVGTLGAFSGDLFEEEAHYIFRGILVYCYAFSLIFTGFFQMVVTRYLSDCFFSEDYDAVLPVYTVTLLILTVIQVATAGVFFYFCEFDLKTAILGTLLYVVISNIWLAMVFLTALRNFHGILISFFVGSALSSVGAISAGMVWQLPGLLGGFTLGQGIILIMLSRNIFSEFRYVKSFDLELFNYFIQYPQLAIIGFSYNLAIWIDKILFWFSHTGTQIKDLIYFCPIYDSAMYIAYLSIVPSMSLFIIRIETNFYDYYRDFYGTIVNKFPLNLIREEKMKMVNSLYGSMERFFKLQGFITLMIILFAKIIIDSANMLWIQIPLLQISTLGAFLHVLLLILSIIILYFDFRNLCMILTVTYLVTNTVFTYISIQMGLKFFGYGYTLSCFISLLVGYYLFAKKMDKLEYITFMRQPIVTKGE